MKLAIVGSRNFIDEKQFTEWMNMAIKEWNGIMPIEVISGGATGADKMGEQWAKYFHIPTKIFRPDWKRFGKAAGIIRNKDIIDSATHVIAPRSRPSKIGRGTQHSISLAQQQQKPIKIYWID